jgi:serine phosphatase RsbU (regulator of sigma subunit)
VGVEQALSAAVTDGVAELEPEDYRAMLDGVADAVTAQTSDRGLIYANAAAARLYGMPTGAGLKAFSTEEFVKDIELFDETGAPLAPAQFPGRLALLGLDPAPVTVRARDRETGTVTWARIKATAIRDPDGHVRLAINLVEDVTELKRSEEAQRFLADASRALAGSLDRERIVATVHGLAVPAIADRCTVELAGDDGAGARTALLTADRTAITVPMAVAGRLLGTLTLAAGASGRRYDEQDLALAEDLGLRAGAALENARLYRTASAIARTLQTSLLPPHLPDVPGAELAAIYRPASDGLEVGGDFYDVFMTAEGQWYLVVGDVCGKGAEAAAVTALARYTARTAAARRRSPAAILRWVGDAMLHQDAAGGRFCTVACAHVDLTRSPARVTVSCGGHPLPVVRRADGSVEEIGAAGTLLGLVDDPELQERSTELRPGDALVLYTDGLTEARAPQVQWSPRELADAVGRAPGDSPRALVEHLAAAALGSTRTPRDDLAVLALRMTD